MVLLLIVMVKKQEKVSLLHLKKKIGGGRRHCRKPVPFPLEAASLSRAVDCLPVSRHQSVVDAFK